MSVDINGRQSCGELSGAELAGVPAAVADKVAAMERKCTELNARLAEMRDAEAQLHRRDDALSEANAVAVQATKLLHQFKARNEALVRECTALKHHAAPPFGSPATPPPGLAPPALSPTSSPPHVAPPHVAPPHGTPPHGTPPHGTPPSTRERSALELIRELREENHKLRSTEAASRRQLNQLQRRADELIATVETERAARTGEADGARCAERECARLRAKLDAARADLDSRSAAAAASARREREEEEEDHKLELVKSSAVVATVERELVKVRASAQEVGARLEASERRVRDAEARAAAADASAAAANRKLRESEAKLKQAEEAHVAGEGAAGANAEATERLGSTVRMLAERLHAEATERRAADERLRIADAKADDAGEALARRAQALVDAERRAAVAETRAAELEGAIDKARRNESAADDAKRAVSAQLRRGFTSPIFVPHLSLRLM